MFGLITTHRLTEFHISFQRRSIPFGTSVHTKCNLNPLREQRLRHVMREIEQEMSGAFYCRSVMEEASHEETSMP